MQTIPDDIGEQYSAVLKKRAVPVSRHADYRKWLRYYLDFRSKYSLPDSKSEHVRLFIEKLRKKNQSPERQKQAAHALSLFFESQPQNIPATEPAIRQQAAVSPTGHGDFKASAPRSSSRPSVPPLSTGKRFNEWRCMQKSESP